MIRPYDADAEVYSIRLGARWASYIAFGLESRLSRNPALAQPDATDGFLYGHID